MIAWERIHARMTEEYDLAKVREAAELAQAQATAVDL
jgi:hypothetical protein